VNIVDALGAPELFHPLFVPAASWTAWRSFLRALFGLPMTNAEREVFRLHTKRLRPPTLPAREAWVVAGRRSGKSRVAALVAVYLAALRDYSAALAPGEVATVALIAGDRRQARTLFRYALGLLEGVPMLHSLIERTTAERIDLRNRCVIEVHTCSFRSTRGYTLAGAIADEVAYWNAEDTANPDSEVIAALRPALLPGAPLLAISSPYARRGELWNAYRRHFGQDGDPVLCWQADTRSMNATIPQHVVDEALEADPERARAEYLAIFRDDVEMFLTREALAAVTLPGRLELPPLADARYCGFVDPSGGAHDSMTLAIAHAEGAGDERRAVLDVLREVRPPFSPDAVAKDFAETLKRYRLREVSGDKYGAAWVAERFREAGVEYRASERTKSQLYVELLPAIHSRRVELLDHAKLLAQSQSLERRTARGGRDSIDHAPGGHDDMANAVAGALVLVLGRRRGVSPSDLFDPARGLFAARGPGLAASRDPESQRCKARRMNHAGRLPPIGVS
jgi:hypothetical protein